MNISFGIPAAHRDTAAALYWQAFGPKLGKLLGPEDRALRFIKSVLREDHAIRAEDAAGNLLGIAGFKSPQGALVGAGYEELRKTYGWVGAAFRTVLFSALTRDVENKRFLIDGLFVAPQARGQGIGTALLEAICQEARTRGYRQVRLDVVDSNSRAKALYLQEGFKELKTTQIGLLRHFFGFRAATAMVCDLYPEPIKAPAAKTSAPPSTT
ncbi:MAG: GNAT family N-acetyltransferase [Yoonia sp.]|uniref:GNAT family N-acetyltransferase n=1 Tax=Yoonia sp. TaxID=2212373 RepID=UPI003EF9B05B